MNSEDREQKGLGLPLALIAGLILAAGGGFYAWNEMDGKTQAKLPQSQAADRASWQPERPIELVIMAGKGGGADRLARFLAQIITKNGLSKQPLVPVNMGGESGGQAMKYLRQNAGNPHIVMMTLNSIFTTPLRHPEMGIDIIEFTPIARMAQDTFLLWVRRDQDIRTVDDYVARVQRAGADNWRMGGTGSGAEDSLVTSMLEKAYGIKHTYVPYKGGGTVARNLLEGKIESTVNNPSEQMSNYQAGHVRPLAAFTPKRLDAFPDVPTFRELGHDLVYFMQRSIVAPPNIPTKAKIFYQELFRKLYTSKEWTTYAKEKALGRAYLADEPLRMYFADERQKHRELLASSE